MSDCENENSLDYDMWEGQFEFVGPSAESECVPQGLLKPYTNGVRKPAGHQWGEDANQVRHFLNVKY